MQSCVGGSFAVCLTFCGCAVEAFAEGEGVGVVEYGVGGWAVAGRGNHWHRGCHQGHALHCVHGRSLP